jgi:segregation and condensation protein A
MMDLDNVDTNITDNDLNMENVSEQVQNVEAVSESVSESISEPNTEAATESVAQTVYDPNAGGIELLVQMAGKGEIDPKNIDIIDVTDRFLKAIAAAPKENLRQSGKTLFHASVLLRLKAEALLVEKNEMVDFGDDFLEFDEDGSPIIYDSKNQLIGRQITLQDLERALVRKAQLSKVRQRKVTLEQLIEALRDAERLEKIKVERKPKAVIDLSGAPEMHDVEDILDLAHDEDIESVIARAEVLLAERLDDEQRFSLIDLIVLLNKTRHGDWVDCFLAVLFLSNAGKISLEQDDFWGPLYVVKPKLESAVEAA